MRAFHRLVLVLLFACTTTVMAADIEIGLDRPGGTILQQFSPPSCMDKCRASLGSRAVACRNLCAVTTASEDYLPKECQIACDKNRNCKSFVYEYPAPSGAGTGTCFLKESTPDPVPSQRHASGKKNPIVVLSFGDSIMWGQGLQSDMKYNSRIAQWIQDNNLTGRPVILVDYSHSGGVITYQAGAIPDDKSAQETWFGEVPRQWPDLSRQLEIALDIHTPIYPSGQEFRPPSLAKLGIKPEWVELILVTAGANDVDFTSLLWPDVDLDHTVLKVRDMGDRMDAFLGELILKRDINNSPITQLAYPNAWVMLTGYFSLFTDKTPDGRLSAIGTLYGISNVVQNVAHVPCDANWILNRVGSLLSGWPMPSEKPECQTDVRAKSAAFYATTQNVYGSLIAKYNNAFPFVGTYLDPEFGPDNGVGGSQEFIRSDLNDPVMQTRIDYCARYGQIAGVCSVASLLHINENGANRYFEQARKRLPILRPSWAGMVVKKALPIVRGEEIRGAGSVNNAQKKVIVRVFDQESREELSGSAQITVTQSTVNPDGLITTLHRRPVTGMTGQEILFPACTKAAIRVHIDPRTHQRSTTTKLHITACSGVVAINGYPNVAFSY